MVIEIPDNDVLNNSLDESAIRLEVALLFYEKEIYSLGKAAEFARISKTEFIAALKARGQYLRYELEDVLQDFDALKNIPYG